MIAGRLLTKELSNTQNLSTTAGRPNAIVIKTDVIVPALKEVMELKDMPPGAQLLKKNLTNMKCTNKNCEYEWKPRAKQPKSCPKCKQYLKKPLKP